MGKVLFAIALLLVASFAQADFFSSSSRVGTVVSYHAMVDTTTALAIPSVSVVGDLYSFQVCNDPVNASSTYLQLGLATDVTTDGIRLGLGQCFVCDNCKPSILKLLKVEGQGATNGYSVLQYKK
jgi:hypothetical protein